MEHRTIGELCNVIGGKPAPSEKEAFENGVIPFLRMKDLGAYHLTNNLVEIESKLNLEYVKRKNLKPIKKGAILLPRSGSVALNHRAILGVDAIIVSHVCALEILNEKILDRKYFYYYMTRVNMANITKKTTGLDAITFEDLRKIEIPLPDLKIQQKIAIILEQADATRQKRKQANQLTKQFLQSAFIEMFGDPVNNDKRWETERLDKISNLERGRFSPRPRNDPSFYDGLYPFIQTGDISRSGFRLNKFTQTLNERGIKVSKQFKTGVIVIAIVGATIGATAILEIDVFATDSIIGIKTYDEFVSNYFLEFVLRFWKPILLKNAPEVARPNINLEILNKLKIVVPPLPIQKRFVTLVKQVEQLQIKQRESEKELENLFNSLMQKYFG